MKKSIKPQFIINNERIIERRVIANEFNKYFVSLASKLNKKAAPVTNNFAEFLPSGKMQIMFMVDCTGFGKSSDVPISVIKKILNIISPILAHLMGTGKFPEMIKLGKITPIFKKEDEQLLKNYRPVSTLPIFGKNFEKLSSQDFIAFSFRKAFCMINNSVFERLTPQIMHLITQ